MIIAVSFPIWAIGNKKAWKNQGFNGIRTHDLRDTGAMLYQLSYEATHREQGQFIELIDLAPDVWLHSSVGRASHRYRGGHGFESRWSPDFFRLFISNCSNWKIYCDDHTSLSSTTAVQIWIISYIFHKDKNFINVSVVLVFTSKN